MVVSLSVIALLVAGQPSWAGAGVDTTAAASTPELLGVPLLTLVWGLTGVLAVVAGLTFASRGARQPSVRSVTDRSADRPGPGPDKNRL